MTVVVNHDTNSVIWCSIGHKKEDLQKFFDGLTPEQRESIRCVSANGARWIADCVKEYCPNAALCIDPFHVVSWATDAWTKSGEEPGLRRIVQPKKCRNVMSDVRKKEKPNLMKRSLLKILKLRDTRC